MSNTVLTKPQWATCAAYLCAGVGRPMGKEQAEVYFDALNDIPFEVLQICCKRAIQEQKENWLPSVGLIRSFASEVANGMLPQAGQEWNAVLEAIRKFGYPRQVEGMASLSKLAQQAVRSIGGWQIICDSDNLPVLSAQFRGAYEASAARESQFRQLSPELRPAIATGPVVTPKIHRAEIDPLVKKLADGFEVPKDKTGGAA